VQVCGDTTFETNETFFVNLSNPSNATISITKGTGTGTITNDDAAPSFSINDVTQAEGNAGTTAFTFTVTKTGATAQSATVDFATANGTAFAAVGRPHICTPAACSSPNYLPTSKTLTFAPTDTIKTITVQVCGDTTFETNETFFVNLSNPSNATISITKGTRTCTFTNADPTPIYTLSYTTLFRSNAGTTAFTFTVTKTGSTAQSATVDFATANGTAFA